MGHDTAKSHATRPDNGGGHVTQDSHHHLRQRACPCLRSGRRLARCIGPSPLLRQLGLQRRRADRRKQARPTPAIAQCLWFLIRSFRQFISARNNLSGKKRRGGKLPSRPNFFHSLVQALRAPCCRASGLTLELSGRSQRGDSAWNKTLDHLLSLLMETAI